MSALRIWPVLYMPPLYTLSREDQVFSLLPALCQDGIKIRCSRLRSFAPLPDDHCDTVLCIHSGRYAQETHLWDADEVLIVLLLKVHRQFFLL